MRRFIPALAASLLAAPAPAFAAALPNLAPAHDVSGTYVMTRPDGTKTFTIEYSKSADTLRIDPQDGHGYILYDFETKDAKLVIPQMQRYMDNPQIADRVTALQDKIDNGDAAIVKGGTETIAGHECTDYNATDKAKDKSASMCVTDDGVLLKITSEDGSIVAQSVSYNDVPAAEVTVPSDYTQFTMPQLPDGMAPGAGQ